MMTFSVVHLRVYDKSTFFGLIIYERFILCFPTFPIRNQLCFLLLLLLL